ncbi:MAG: NAD(P)/FAD-dependent oxidoreductase [Chitinophagaceae bacterium]
MPETTYNQYDILVAGAGFTGSLTALVLHHLGFKVGLLEKGHHPRFTIGESSTPVADMILRNLASKYNLPWLHDFSRYGSWQQSHPEIVCGIKRGFSFFKHYPGKDFTTDENHKNELLVAASVNDFQSDTNWLRADLDTYLVNKVKESGIDYFDLTEIITAKRNAHWEFHISRLNDRNVIHASFFIDATGSGGLLNRLLGIQFSSGGFLTKSFALFSHFNHVPRWTDMMKKAGISSDDFPYNPDHSALHHILEEGWLWMLRFNDDRTSLGFVLGGEVDAYTKVPTERIWNEMLRKYPSINHIIKDASLASQPGMIIRSGRLQRKIMHCFGPGWAALPHTAGFVDPLFSSGIAHTLSGIEKIIPIISQYWGNNDLLQQTLNEYEHAVFEELKLIDYLVAGCYKTMDHFELFNVWSMLYFASTIAHEQRRIRHQSPGYFLNADDSAIWDIVQKSYADLLKILSQQHPSPEDIKWFTSLVRERIHPFNTAGLLEPSCKNMYTHTAAVK